MENGHCPVVTAVSHNCGVPQCMCGHILDITAGNSASRVRSAPNTATIYQDRTRPVPATPPRASVHRDTVTLVERTLTHVPPSAAADRAPAVRRLLAESRCRTQLLLNYHSLQPTAYVSRAHCDVSCAASATVTSGDRVLKFSLIEVRTKNPTLG